MRTQKTKIIVVMRFVSIWMCLFTLCFIGPSKHALAAGNNYYVSTSGNNDWDGLSPTHTGGNNGPWANPSHAAQQAEAGDTIHLLDGTWNDEYVEFANSGTEGNPITMKAYSGTPVFYCIAPVHAVSIGIKIYRKSYINIEGITLRRNYRGIYIRKSSHIHIKNCEVYTENALAQPGDASLKGIVISDGSHDCSIDNCLVDGNAWNSISLSGREAHDEWYSDVSYNITVKNCVSRNNRVHNLLDLMGCMHHIYIENNTFYEGHSGSIFSHQGFPENLYIRNNTVYDCYDGIHLCTGTSNSVIENNTFYDLENVNGHSIRITATKTYVDTTFVSSNNIIRNNHCRGDVSYYMLGLGGKDCLVEENDVHSDFGDTEYRFDRSVTNGILRNAIGAKYRVRASNDAEVNVEYTDGRTFSVDGSGEYTTYTFSNETYNIEVIGWIDVGNISGTVTDDAASLPVEGAVASDGTRSDTTDGSGNYMIENVPVGMYTVTCIKPGYNPSTQTVTVSEGGIAIADFQLYEATDIIGLWHFDEGNGTTARDSSGNENHGTISGATWITGTLGSALEFNGADDYVSVHDSASLDSITDEITLIAWVKTSKFEDYQNVIEKWDFEGADQRSFEFKIRDDGTVNLGISPDGTSSEWLTSAGSVSSNAWMHIAATSDGTTMKIYINGELDPNTASAPVSGIFQSTADLHIGHWWDGENWVWPFAGAIDEVKIYRRALTATEIKADFETDDTTPLVVTLKTITVNGFVDEETVTDVDINGITVPVTAGAYSHEVDVTSTGTITITAENGDGKTVTRAITIN